MRYNASEVDRILMAYRTLFPRVEGALAEYWDFARTRPWSFLTTDFHSVTPDAIQQFDEAVRIEALLPGAPDEVGARLRLLSQAHGVGFSLGISPWTDDLLLRTFSAKTRRVVIILGHDWYPIVTADLSYRTTPPLERFSVFDETRYGEAVPGCLWADGETAVLFLNLYPDFRPPATDVMGSLGDYGLWLRGFESLCASVSGSFEITSVISWGSNVWGVLNRKLDRQWHDRGIMAAVTRQLEQGHPNVLSLGALRLSYYAFAHPSFTPNFRRAIHLKAFEAAMDHLRSRGATTKLLTGIHQ